MTDSQKERAKLVANALDRTSTASLAIGVFTPIASAMYGTNAGLYPLQSLELYVGALSWLFAAAAMLHAIAHVVLRRRRVAEAQMTGPYFVAFVAMPLTVVALGFAAACWHKYAIVPGKDED